MFAGFVSAVRGAVRPAVVVLAVIAIGFGVAWSFVSLGGSHNDAGGHRYGWEASEKIIVNPRYEWEESCAHCGRRNGEDGVQNHYCRHCSYSFKLRVIPDPY